jgi:hypothetical protein
MNTRINLKLVFRLQAEKKLLDQNCFCKFLFDLRRQTEKQTLEGKNYPKTINTTRLNSKFSFV